jgi:Pectinacetylesterase
MQTTRFTQLLGCLGRTKGLVRSATPPSAPRRRPSHMLRLALALASLAVMMLGLAAPATASTAQTSHAPFVEDGSMEAGYACGTGTSLCHRSEGVACADLGATWASGTATCRDDCSGYDVSTCTRATPMTNRERVRPADRDARWAAARCNDGTPFSFQVRLSQSGSQTWVIGLTGGGACDDYRSECAAHPPPLTTTEGHDRDFSEDFLAFVPGPPQPLAGPFDLDTTENPTFADAHHVWAQNCSSDFYSGTSTELIPNSASATGWYFSGRHNIRAMLEILKQRHGLHDTAGTRLLVIGQSAGGSGVVANADQFVAIAPKAAAKGNLRLVLEGMWNGDIDDPDARLGTLTVSDREAFQHSYAFWQARSNGICELRAHPADCYLGVEGYNSVAHGYGLPTLVFQNRSDPTLLGEHSVFDPQAAVVGRYEKILEQETRSVRWFFSPKDRRMIGYPLPWQIMSPFHIISSLRYFYDYSTPVWRAGNGGQNFRATLTRFWHARRSSSERVTFDQFDNVPPQAFQLP